MKIETDVCLKKYNSWKVGGHADYFCAPTNLEEIKQAEAFAIENNLTICVLGSGSNVLISDEGIRGLVICTKKFKDIEINKTAERLELICDAGVAKFVLMKTFLKAGLAPAIFLSGLPGDVGGGIVMNAGVSEPIKPREFVEICDWFEVLEQGKIKRFTKDTVNWSYRHCRGWEPGIIVRAGFSWTLREASEDIKTQAAAFAKTRKDRQPLEMPSCGSTFVNPAKDTSAGFLIEQAGLKGFQIGGAAVSEKHANFIVNLGDSTAKDIQDVLDHVVTTVESQFGIRLQTEVKFL